jgi:hypothetical protein
MHDKIVMDKGAGRLVIREEAWQYVRAQLVENVINVVTHTPTVALLLHANLGGDAGAPLGKVVGHEDYDPEGLGAEAHWVEVQVVYFPDPTTNGHGH